MRWEWGCNDFGSDERSRSQGVAFPGKGPSSLGVRRLAVGLKKRTVVAELACAGTGTRDSWFTCGVDTIYISLFAFDSSKGARNVNPSRSVW
jgi:hypothetical protein